MFIKNKAFFISLTIVFLMGIFYMPVSAAVPSGNIVFPDINFRNALLAPADKNKDGYITKSEMATLSGTLSLPNANISNIAGIEFATGITGANLNINKIIYLTPLKGLTNLKSLDISGNLIADISAVSGLKNLESLYFSTNKVVNLAPIKGLIKLKNLEFYNNMVKDISTISGLTNLTKLIVFNNNVSNITPISKLINLQELDIWSNKISDISPLHTLKYLKKLVMNKNSVTNISPLSKLLNLQFLILDNNKISDISAISSLLLLNELYLNNNSIVSITPLKSLKKLSILGLNYNYIKNISTLDTLAGLKKVKIQNNSFDYSAGTPARIVIEKLLAKKVIVDFEDIPIPSATPKVTPRPTPKPTLKPVPPVITVFKYNTKLTNKNITVTVKTNKGILYSNKYIFKKNGKHVFQVVYKAKIYSKVVVITNIDKTSPKIVVKNSKGNIVSYNGSAKGSVTVSATDKNLLKKSISRNKMIVKWPTSGKISIKGSYIVICNDKAGNVTKYLFKII